MFYGGVPRGQKGVQLFINERSKLATCFAEGCQEAKDESLIRVKTLFDLFVQPPIKFTKCIDFLRLLHRRRHSTDMLCDTIAQGFTG